MNFACKVVVITGASSGIGAATALNFAKYGASLVLSALDEKGLKIVASKIPGDKRPVILKGDLTDQIDSENLIQTAVDTFGRLDVLVNNAGILESGSLESTSMEQFDRIMKVNVRSIFQLTKFAVPYLVITRGNIINLSGVSGLRSTPNLLAYSISKAGVEQFSRCVGLELAAKGIRCNSVSPGVICTNLHLSGGMKEAEYKKFLERSKTTHPLGRVGEPDEVAKAITFLASDLSAFTTCACISVDGGRHSVCPR